MYRFLLQVTSCYNMLFYQYGESFTMHKVLLTHRDLYSLFVTIENVIHQCVLSRNVTFPWSGITAQETKERNGRPISNTRSLHIIQGQWRLLALYFNAVFCDGPLKNHRFRVSYRTENSTKYAQPIETRNVHSIRVYIVRYNDKEY